jgi:hypothetical protein
MTQVSDVAPGPLVLIGLQVANIFLEEFKHSIYIHGMNEL